jgi:hypothetical protein
MYSIHIGNILDPYILQLGAIVDPILKVIDGLPFKRNGKKKKRN